MLRDRPNARDNRTTYKISVRNSEITKLLETLIKWKGDIKIDGNFQLRPKKHLYVQCCPDILKSVPLFDSSEGSPACPSDKNSMKLKMSVEHWWNVTNSGKLKYWERNII